MDTALQWSRRSTCTRLSVGCVITPMEMDAILSFGYNGPGKYLHNYRCHGVEGACGCVHAEMNAVAGVDRYVPKVAFITHSSCEVCAQLLLRVNVRKVYFGQRYRDDAGIKVFQEAILHGQPDIAVYQVIPCKGPLWNTQRVA